MFEYLIYNQLKKFSRANKSFHVPGHKAKADFKQKFPVAGMDVTELSYSDNLFCPTGVIAKAQRDVAQILGACRSYFLTGGSTAGVLAMTWILSKRGSKVIVARNCHQSVWNGCALFGLEPVIVQGECRDGVILPSPPELIERLLDNDVNIGGMIVDNPDYYGNIAPLGEYAEILKKRKRLLAVDGAHGAHLVFEPESKGYSGVYADIWVDGAHKSLPTLTQGAILSVKDEKLIPAAEEALAYFRTTSPSYPIMASVEYGVKYVANNPKLYENAKLAREAFVNKLNSFTFYPSQDWTKLAIDFKPLGISPEKAAKMLEKRHIYAELSDGRYLLFYLSPTTTARELNSLANAITEVAKSKKLKNTFKKSLPFTEMERTYSFQYALSKPTELVPLDDAVGRMCARNTGVAPPCIPVLVAGEIVTAEAVSKLKSATATYGIYQGKICVVKK